MANIRLDLETPMQNGQPVTFKSPIDCSSVTGLIVYFPNKNGENDSHVFQFADAHGNNVGSTSLFASNVLVKVILDTESNKAFVQNADTNKYLEDKFADLDRNKAPMYTWGTEDLVEGVSKLPPGQLYFVMEKG